MILVIEAMIHNAAILSNLIYPRFSCGVRQKVKILKTGLLLKKNPFNEQIGCISCILISKNKLFWCWNIHNSSNSFCYFFPFSVLPILFHPFCLGSILHQCLHIRLVWFIWIFLLFSLFVSFFPFICFSFTWSHHFIHFPFFLCLFFCTFCLFFSFSF